MFIYFLGEIIVSDTDDKSVNLISAGGQQISKLSCTFQCPVGVTVDSNDNVIVADWDGKIRVNIVKKMSLHLCVLLKRTKINWLNFGEGWLPWAELFFDSKKPISSKSPCCT